MRNFYQDVRRPIYPEELTCLLKIYSSELLSPLLPGRPSGPNRLIFYTVILALGFGSGIGIAFLISQLNPILIRPKQLLSVSDYPIWGTVTHLNIEQINKTNRNRLLVFLFSAVLYWQFTVR